MVTEGNLLGLWGGRRRQVGGANRLWDLLLGGNTELLPTSWRVQSKCLVNP
jgi:hypothetical protein